MTVATLFVQMAFQAALQPPSLVSDDLSQKLRPKSSANAESPAAITGVTAKGGHGMPSLRASCYVAFNTLTFATALTFLLTLVLVKKRTLPRRTIRYVPSMVSVLAFSTSCTYVLVSSYSSSVTTLVCCAIVFNVLHVAYHCFDCWPLFKAVCRQATCLVLRMTSKAISLARV
ncbi:hypothetical protein E2562_038060 [Oryza meyeriana var. granulata]|uniref:PGG domain-containing protein n=1 Tax=Oryza meyeriana var. granulata TaxID=110450 RepID=A0A6G1EU11_9ORYZ|nr:hypothetical protein E2562_038060 [Oryza meyeriana var. granulata]